MAKFNIEVELDWVDGEDGYTIDEEIKEQVVSPLYMDMCDVAQEGDQNGIKRNRYK